MGFTLRHILSAIILTAISVLVISCQGDPEPEEFAMPSFVNLTVEGTSYGCVLRCEVSSSGHVKSCGFLFGEDEMEKLEGTFVSDKVFEAKVTQYSPGTIYTFQAYISNGSSEVKSQKAIWTAPSNHSGGTDEPDNPNLPSLSDIISVSAAWDDDNFSCHLTCRVSTFDDVESFGFMFGQGSLTRYEGKKTETNVFEADIDGITLNSEYSFLAYIVKGGEEIRSEAKTWSIPADYVSSTIKIGELSVEEAEGGCILRCKYMSLNPDLIESVCFTYSIQGLGHEGMIEGKITSEEEFEAFMTGLSSETIYNFKAEMTVGGESFHSKSVSWISPSYPDFVNVEAFWKKDNGKNCILECETVSLGGVDSYGFYLWDASGTVSTKFWGEKTGTATFNADTKQNDDSFEIASRQKYYLQAYIVKGEYEYRSKLKEWTAPDFGKSVYIDETYVYFIDGLCSLWSTVHTPSEDAIVDGYFLFGKAGSELERFDADGEFVPDEFGKAIIEKTVVSDFVPDDYYNFQVIVVTKEGTVSTDVLLCQVYSDETNERFLRVEAYRNPDDGNLCFISELSSMSGVESCGFVFGTEQDILERRTIGATSISGNVFRYDGPSNVEILPETDYFLQAVYYGDPNGSLGNYSFPVKVNPSSMEKDFTTISETSGKTVEPPM